MLVGPEENGKDWNELNIEKYYYKNMILQSCEMETYLFYAEQSYKEKYDFCYSREGKIMIDPI